MNPLQESAFHHHMLYRIDLHNFQISHHFLKVIQFPHYLPLQLSNMVYTNPKYYCHIKIELLNPLLLLYSNKSKSMNIITLIISS